MTTFVIKGIQRDLYRWVKRDDGGGHSEPAGFELLDVSVEVNVDSIARHLGRKAAANKSGSSKYLDGDVIVTVLSRIKGKAS